MNNTEIKEALYQLNATMLSLEDEYVENGGEVTESTEAKEQIISNLKEMLTGEGIDSLGRWLAAKEDEVKRYKAEKDAATRRMNAANRTIDFIKYMVNIVLTKTEMEKAKGSFYSFTPTISVKIEVDKDILKTIYSAKVEEAIRSAHIPCYVGVTLTASSKAAEEFGVVEGDEQIFSKVSTPSCRFVKPRETKTKE